MAWHTRIIGYDPATKIVERHHFDPDTGNQVLETTGDVTDIVAETKARYAMVDERERWRDGFNHVASVPLQVIDKVRRETGVNLLVDKTAMKEFLNNSDNRAFRTRPGRI